MGTPPQPVPESESGPLGKGADRLTKLLGLAGSVKMYVLGQGVKKFRMKVDERKLFVASS